MTTFTVEDGTGLADSNAYCSTAFADDYFALRGITAWTGSSTVKEQAIVKATDYIENRFGDSFKGSRAVEGQALSFPRADVVLKDGREVDEASVPDAIAKATAEYALRALTGELFPDPPGPNEANGEVVMERKKLAVLETEVQYKASSDSGPRQTIPSYPAADALIFPYTNRRRTVSR